MNGVRMWAAAVGVLVLTGCGTTVVGSPRPPDVTAATSVVPEPTSSDPTSSDPTSSGPTSLQGTGADEPTENTSTSSGSTISPTTGSGPQSTVRTTEGFSGGASWIVDPVAQELADRIDAAVIDTGTFRATVSAEPDDGDFVGEVAVALEDGYIVGFEMEGGEGDDFVHLIYSEYTYYYRAGSDDLFEKVEDTTDDTDRLDELDELMEETVASVGFARPELVLLAVEVPDPVAEEISGVMTEKYVLELDLTAADRVEDLAGDPDLVESLTELADLGMERMPIVLWVDEQGNVLQFRQEFSAGGYDSVLMQTIRDVNQTLELHVPQPDEIVTG